MARNLRQLHCDIFQVTALLDPANFKQKEFILRIKQENEKNKKQKVSAGSTVHMVFESKQKTRKEHAHFTVELSNKESSVRLAYHPFKAEGEIKDGKSPYLEDAASWFAEFFHDPICKFDVFTVFKYGNQYQSLLRLDYPLLFGNDLLQETVVVGHDIVFLSDPLVTSASVTIAEKGFLVFLLGEIEVDLSLFNVHEVAEKYSQYANAFVEKKEK